MSSPSTRGHAHLTRLLTLHHHHSHRHASPNALPLISAFNWLRLRYLPGRNTMPSSVSGGQLPLTAFFGSRSTQSSNQPGQNKGDKSTRKRAGSPTRAKNTQVSFKKRKQKENFDSAGKSALVSRLEECGRSVGPEDSSTTVHSDSSPEYTQINVHPSLKHSTHTDSPPATPERLDRMHRPLAAASLPSPPLTAPSLNRRRKTHEKLTPDDVDASCATLPSDNPGGENNGSCNV